MTTRWSSQGIARGRDTLDAARSDVEADGAVLAVVDVHADVEVDQEAWWPVAAAIVVDPASRIAREDLALVVGAHEPGELRSAIQRHLSRVETTSGRQLEVRWRFQGSEDAWHGFAAEHGLDDDGGSQ